MSEFQIDDIMKFLPHRYPMLLLDRILEVVPGVSCVGLKNVTYNEAFFHGHYPDYPVMPGVLIIEAMAQAGAVIILADEKCRGKVPLIGAIDNVKFRRQVIPGDQLITHVKVLYFRNNIGKVVAESHVDGELVATMESSFKLIERTASGEGTPA